MKQALLISLTLSVAAAYPSTLWRSPNHISQEQQDQSTVSESQGDQFTSSQDRPSPVTENTDVDLTQAATPQLTQQQYRQIIFLISQNFVEKIESLESSLASLQGKIDEQNHELIRLKRQQRLFYQDIDLRMNTQKNSISLTEDEHAYKLAYHDLKNQKYQDAFDKFDAFFKQYASSKYRANALYWMAEIKLQSGDLKHASQLFTDVTDQFTHHPKSADAWLKLAIIAEKLGHKQQAINAYQTVIKHYPTTPAARLAKLKYKS